MLSIFSYDFMIKAFIVGILISIITPCIGLTIVLRRFSMLGDAISHNSLAGVAGGLIMGINPVLGAIAFSIISTLAIEKIRKSFSKYSEIAIAVIMSTGIGLAGVLSGFVKNSANFNSFLFGSIVAIEDFELKLVVGLSIVVIIAVVALYKELFYMSFDEEAARLAGIPVRTINFVFMILTALAISLASRTVGTLVVSSLMVLPVACSMQIAKSYKKTMVLSIFFAISFTITGLYLSYYCNLRPGGTIVLTGVIVLVGIILTKNIINAFRVKRKETYRSA
ncbi:metal ABC transporter permease [Clostridium manihotivorum]|uniref:Metal ABC transporter permease n=1 Tax=Clostridium manihotivorum TaxID=2320868 RepID=A0A410DPH6_9CLOT|nr:metal ABC transporter permease [Clostridium manihotivorum]QAA30989.1 metal ABC transporter permease [Clostridium manihotivorum]